MDWNGTLTFVSRQQPPYLNSLYNHNYDHQYYPGMEMENLGFVPSMEKKKRYKEEKKKKKRLRNDQLEWLEMSFQEDIKLEPERKMKLSKQLGLQPRQIAVWFQNRRARWKTKELERLYDALKQQFHVVSKEKQMLQDEVLRLKAMLSTEQSTRNQLVSTCYPEVSGKETVDESTSIRGCNKPPVIANDDDHPVVQQCNYLFNVEEYSPNPVGSPYWGVQLPSYP